MLMVRPAYFLFAPSKLLDSFGESDLAELTLDSFCAAAISCPEGGTQFLHLVQNTKGLRQIIASHEANSCPGGCSGGGLGTIESVFVAGPPRHCPPGHGESERLGSWCALHTSCLHPAYFLIRPAYFLIHPAYFLIHPAYFLAPLGNPALEAGISLSLSLYNYSIRRKGA